MPDFRLVPVHTFARGTLLRAASDAGLPDVAAAQAVRASVSHGLTSSGLTSCSVISGRRKRCPDQRQGVFLLSMANDR